MLVADIMGIPDELGNARVNERFHWALSPLACKQVDFGIAEIPENSVLTSLIRTLERREHTRVVPNASKATTDKRLGAERKTGHSAVPGFDDGDG
ncbi:hypothetical protein Pmar_PMAR022643 [Perkinsus marinus ATCC 50983]|uniref:Uncharacterized protein n=1 Tax=Perkinsus marinus (strain ATCC 50983 / TXsc) TaxID=423536 RepID=C5L9J7_PERM5|nr:hypothetical protein Pmar_PMAR022643 [Perkinsus marinus ATCC 50983]EER06590.1 hypothetical protein Pmar_PMAR022643 [Perkinsus marinus ATCC 50983]|eukprot:XP_002774774.1 hypothetical protein Pmar_PMAR022643 [Perkinsus marinus ATCC 50983]